MLFCIWSFICPAFRSSVFDFFGTFGDILFCFKHPSLYTMGIFSISASVRCGSSLTVFLEPLKYLLLFKLFVLSSQYNMLCSIVMSVCLVLAIWYSFYSCYGHDFSIFVKCYLRSWSLKDWLAKYFKMHQQLFDIWCERGLDLLCFCLKKVGKLKTIISVFKSEWPNPIGAPLSIWMIPNPNLILLSMGPWLAVPQRQDPSVAHT